MTGKLCVLGLRPRQIVISLFKVVPKGAAALCYFSAVMFINNQFNDTLQKYLRFSVIFETLSPFSRRCLAERRA